jgi:hypothetical protein
LGIAQAARESGKDSLLLCLLAPPASTSEKTLLEEARAALSGSARLQKVTQNVRRLHELELGLPFLVPAWGERVQSSRDLQELRRLDRALTEAPILAAKSAVASKLLIAALDEPKEGSGPTELDGEHVHSVRIFFWDMVRDKTLLSLRRRVDPSFISPGRRAAYARELDSCKLGVELRQAVSERSPLGATGQAERTDK